VTDFDPNVEPESQEQADAYINWCAENFMRLSQGDVRTYRTATRCAPWLFIVASAQLHLDESVTDNREELLEQLALYQKLGRAMERQRVRLAIENFILLRGSLDCWEPVGVWSESLLIAAKGAISARLLIDAYPLVELWDVRCDDVWSLLEAGREALARINDADELSFADYAVRPDEMVMAKYTWQRAHNIIRGAGLHSDVSPN
jgi:hypothetical protein